jgi:hypothetical protein
MAFESNYGMKVQCRLILYPNEGNETSLRAATHVWERARASREAFLREAKSQPNATLAAGEGSIQPICRYAAGADDTIEKEAFKLQPGEISRLIGTKQGYVILFCDAHIPPDQTKNFQVEKANLEREVIDKKAQVMIPKFFEELKKQADPKFVLRKQTEDELLRDVQKELGTGTPVGTPAGPMPGGH